MCKCEWHPIETFPKDGKLYIVSDGYEVKEATWLTPDEMADETEGDYTEAGIHTYGGWSAQAVIENKVLTHWIEMPPSPLANP